MVLHRAGNFAAARPVLDEVLARFSARTEPPIRERLGACMLDSFGRYPEAVRVFQEVLTRFERERERPPSETLTRSRPQSTTSLALASKRSPVSS